MTGAVFADVVHAVLPGSGGSLGAYALVGMGAVFAGAARAPITAVVILFELTGEYTIILPLMLAIVLATGISHLVSHDTVYTRKLLRRGIDIDEAADATLRRRPVSDVMTTPPTPVEAGSSLRSVAARFATAGGGSLPVTDSAGHYLGTLAAHGLMDALASGEDTSIEALTVSTAPLAPAASIGDALKQLDTGTDAVPVQDTDGGIVGWVRHRDMLTALTTTTP
jgi:CIC family chloride channel protein